MIVGYMEKHDTVVYRMWNPFMKHVLVTSNIIWLKQMMYQKCILEDEVQLPPEIAANIVVMGGQEIAAEEEKEAEAEETQETNHLDGMITSEEVKMRNISFKQQRICSGHIKHLMWAIFKITRTIPAATECFSHHRLEELICSAL